MRVHPSLAPIVDLMFPPRCPLCGDLLATQDGLCGPCWATLVVPGEPACTLCQRPFPDEMVEGSVCAGCMAQEPRHDGIAAATLYNESSRTLVLAFKHGRRIALAPMLARLMLSRIRGVDGDWLVIPVPLHRWRIFSRGYNQSALLAREIARGLGAALEVDALERVKRTPRLVGMGAKARARVLSGAIRVKPGKGIQLKGRKVLLVDDVLTSGATSGACVAALRRAGAVQVKISCFARVLDEALPAI